MFLYPIKYQYSNWLTGFLDGISKEDFESSVILTQMDFQLGSEIIRNSYGDTHPLNISGIDPPDPQLANI